ncbi:MAG: Endoplasmic reticulum zinc transporter [Bogoriella megaspora]|nr:MAG: Endoplasmic reticulum zinc transporter [Bogoriella megaspora]
MASQRPIPQPPRTPTPPPEDEAQRSAGLESQAAGLGFSVMRDTRSSAAIARDSNALSPTSAEFPLSGGSNLSIRPSPTTTDYALYSPIEDAAGDSQPSTAGLSAPNKSPFNFTPIQYSAGGKSAGSIGKSGMGQRRGHRYKHSSISHQIFLEPAPKAPLQLPASLPLPTPRECWKSMSREQTSRLAWCFCHLFIAGYVQWNAASSLSLTSLSRLLFFDAVGAFICVGVDVWSNFEVWKRTSIRHPFGLERADVLAGFGMAILLAFMGLDLISHGAQHALENQGGHEAHRSHSHGRVSAGAVDADVALSIIATLVSALGLGNHKRIGRSVRIDAIKSLPGLMKNPSHALTLSVSTALLILPLLSVQMYGWLDGGISLVVAAAMCFLGARLGVSLGSVLLMSYRDPEKKLADVLRAIESDPAVSKVEESGFWQVHYGLRMANLKLRCRRAGMNDEGIARLRERVSNVVKNELGGVYGGGGAKWEVSTQISLDRD